MRAAACDDNAPDRLAATAARFFSPLVNAQPLPESSRASLGVQKIAEACAPKRDGAVEHFPHCPMQAPRGKRRDFPSRGEGMDPRREERLVRVNVAHT